MPRPVQGFEPVRANEALRVRMHRNRALIDRRGKLNSAFDSAPRLLAPPADRPAHAIRVPLLRDPQA